MASGNCQKGDLFECEGELQFSYAWFKPSYS
jgi:hypothetical protein